MLTEIARCVGSMNLSLTFGSSEQLRHLLVYAASLGATINLPQEKTLESAEKIIPHYDRKEIRNRMIKLAHEVKNISCKRLSQLPYVSIAADEGSTRGTKNLDFVVEFPGFELRSFPILTLRMDSLLATNYSKVFNIGLRIIHSHGINIGSIIAFFHLKHNIPFRHSEDLIQILVIFKSLIIEFEDSKAYLSQVYPRIEAALEALDELYSDGNPFAKDFKETLNSYTIGSKDGGIWLLAYLFTPAGVNDYKKRILQSHPRPFGKNYLSQFKLERFLRKEDNEELIEEVIDENSIEALEETESMEQEQFKEDDYIADVIINPEPTDDDVSDDDEDEVIPENAQSNILQMAKEFLIECIKKQEIREKDIIESVTLFQG